MKHTTIKDIAREMGISKSTVSRALRDHYDINPETREAVLAMAKKMNYSTSAQAIAFQHKQTNMIAVVVPEIDNPFFSNCINGVDHASAGTDYHIIINQTRNDARVEAKIIDRLISMRVDGIIISLALDTQRLDHLKKIQALEMPLVLFDRISDRLDCYKIYNDDFDGAYRATRHLIDKGYKNIVHLAGAQNLFISRERLAGYEKALLDAGRRPLKENVIETNFKKEEAEALTSALLQHANRPDALFAVSDHVALGAIMAARKLNLRVPEDIAIVGFSDLPYAEMLNPALTTVKQPSFDMGKLAFDMIMEQIQRGTQGETRSECLKTELIERGTA